VGVEGGKKIAAIYDRKRKRAEKRNKFNCCTEDEKTTPPSPAKPTEKTHPPRERKKSEQKDKSTSGQRHHLLFVPEPVNFSEKS